jgi:hypothetical protein
MKHDASGLFQAPMRKSLCAAAMIAASACATAPAGYEEWTAQGWLTPGPSGEPEIIGVYAAKDECLAAADAWMSRQVVGNPVYANCLPVDPH